MSSDPTTCGLDGTCDGAGACRRHPAGTPCAQESCSDGAPVSTYTPARTCNGTGTCAAATTSNCGTTYRCAATKCRTTCVGNQDCVSGAYCSGTTCVAKKPDKEVCSSNTECLTGTCGGRCCAAGCTCTQPSAGNILKNPGFDEGTTGWTINQGTLVRSLADAEQCPYSGSLMTTVEAGGNRHIEQCVKNTPLAGVFNFGARIRAGGAGQVVCQITFWSGFNCDADTLLTNETQGLAPLSGWQSPGTDSYPDGTPISGANSVTFSCSLGAGLSAPTEFNLDMLYITRATGRY